MPISIFCMFFAFAFSTAVAGVHQKLRTPSWLVGALTPVFVAAFWCAAMAMPFGSVVAEVPLVLLASVAASGPVALMLRGNLEMQAAKEKRAEGHAVEFRTDAPVVKTGRQALSKTGIAAMVLFLPVMAITMSTLISRLNYASWLRWECDGRILQVTKDTGNHGAPMLFVETEGKTDRFSQVDTDAWSQAKPGMRLTKAAGSPMAWLDGRKVRMVPLQVKWWNDAK